MQNSLKLNESRRQEQKREMVIFKNYKCGLKLYCISFKAMCFNKEKSVSYSES